MSITRLSPPTVAPPFGSYSHAVQVEPGHRWLHVSGQVGVMPDGTMAEGIEGQCRQAFANLRAILDHAGMTLDDVVKVNVFLTRAEDVAPYRAVRNEALEGRRPASTLLVVQALAVPEWLVEIELVAAQAA